MLADADPVPPTDRVLTGFSLGDLDRAIRMATFLAGRSVTRMGFASVPTPEEVAQADPLRGQRRGDLPEHGRHHRVNVELDRR